MDIQEKDVNLDLRRGARGGEVKQLQSFLNQGGANLKTDSIFGPLTDAALKSFQSRNRQSDVVASSDGIRREEARSNTDADDLRKRSLKTTRATGRDIEDLLSQERELLRQHTEFQQETERQAGAEQIVGSRAGQRQEQGRLTSGLISAGGALGKSGSALAAEISLSQQHRGELNSITRATRNEINKLEMARQQGDFALVKEATNKINELNNQKLAIEQTFFDNKQKLAAVERQESESIQNIVTNITEAGGRIPTSILNQVLSGEITSGEALKQLQPLMQRAVAAKNAQEVASLRSGTISIDDLDDNSLNAAINSIVGGSSKFQNPNDVVAIKDAIAQNDPDLVRQRMTGILIREDSDAQKKFRLRSEMQARLSDIKTEMIRLRDEEGVKTGVLSGTFSKMKEAVGKDTNLSNLGVMMKLLTQTYTKAQSGAAFSDKEMKNYESVLPGKFKNTNLNLSMIDGFLAGIGSTDLDSFMKEQFPTKTQDYDSLIAAASSGNNFDGDLDLLINNDIIEDEDELDTFFTN